MSVLQWIKVIITHKGVFNSASIDYNTTCNFCDTVPSEQSQLWCLLWEKKVLLADHCLINLSVNYMVNFGLEVVRIGLLVFMLSLFSDLGHFTNSGVEQKNTSDLRWVDCLFFGHNSIFITSNFNLPQVLLMFALHIYSPSLIGIIRLGHFLSHRIVRLLCRWWALRRLFLELESTCVYCRGMPTVHWDLCSWRLSLRSEGPLGASELPSSRSPHARSSHHQLVALWTIPCLLVIVQWTKMYLNAGAARHVPG